MRTDELNDEQLTLILDTLQMLVEERDNWSVICTKLMDYYEPKQVIDAFNTLADVCGRLDIVDESNFEE